MKKLIAILALLTLSGCASTLVFERGKDGSIRFEASDYSIKVTKTGVVAAPNRWFNANSLGGLIAQIFSNLAPLITRPEPTYVAPSPEPTPVPTPTPTPVEPVEPTPTPVEPVPPVPPAPTPSGDTVFTKAGNLITLDLDTLPERMNKAGFECYPNACWYALAYIYSYGPGSQMPDDSSQSLAKLQPVRQQIFDWFDAEVLKVIALMKADKNLSLIAISNDGKDRCGFRLGPAIVERVLNDPAISASRVQVGQTLSPDDY